MIVRIIVFAFQDSLGGNTKTVMVANFGPAASNIEETISTLRYADRAKHIKNKPRINEDPKDTALRAYMDEISMLKAQLAARKSGTVVAGGGLSMTAPAFQVQGVDAMVEEEVVVVEKVIHKVIDDTDEVVQAKREEMRSDIASLQDAAAKVRDRNDARCCVETSPLPPSCSLTCVCVVCTCALRLCLSLLQEREALLAKQSHATRKASEYEAALQSKQAQLSKEQQEMARLETIISEKEARLLHGGQILDQVRVPRACLAMRM